MLTGQAMTNTTASPPVAIFLIKVHSSGEIIGWLRTGGLVFRLAIYGKGGIGKSTMASNVSAALAADGLHVMQIGCDPKADSTRIPMRGERITTVLDAMRDAEAAGREVQLEEVVRTSPDGVLCVEAGGPIPGVGCAGRGIVAAFDLLKQLDAYALYRPDIVIYDVLGDVVCGGFAMPLRGEHSDAVMVVTSGEMMSLYAAGNILHAVSSFQRRGYARFAGLIANLRDVESEERRIEEFCADEGAWVAGTIPRSRAIQQADERCVPVGEIDPESAAWKAYRGLASLVASMAEGSVPLGSALDDRVSSAGSAEAAKEV